MNSSSLYRNSIYLLINNAALAATGVIFWSLSARYFSPEDVGITTLLLTTATFISCAGTFGLDQSLIKFSAKSGDENLKNIANTAFSISAIGTVVFSSLYLLLIPRIIPELSFITHSWLWTILFFWTMAITTWSILISSLFVALRIACYVLLSSLVFCVLRIVLLPILSGFSLIGIFGAYILSFSLATLLGFMFMIKTKKYIYKPRINKKVVNQLKNYSSKAYVSALLASVPALALPIVILTSLGATETAYYYMPVLIVGLLNIIPINVGQSLFAEGSTELSGLRENTIKSLKFVYLLLLPLVVIVLLAGQIILKIFGTGYVEHGYLLLVLLTFSTLFKAGNYLLSSILRILGDVKEIMFITFLYVTLNILLSCLALKITNSLWGVGAAALVSEAAVLPMYWMVTCSKWNKHIARNNSNVDWSVLNA